MKIPSLKWEPISGLASPSLVWGARLWNGEPISVMGSPSLEWGAHLWNRDPIFGMGSLSLKCRAHLWNGEPVSVNQVRNIQHRSSCELPGALAAACSPVFLGAVFLVALAWELGVCPHSGRSCGFGAEARPLAGP